MDTAFHPVTTISRRGLLAGGFGLGLAAGGVAIANAVTDARIGRTAPRFGGIEPVQVPLAAGHCAAAHDPWEDELWVATRSTDGRTIEVTALTAGTLAPRTTVTLTQGADTWSRGVLAVLESSVLLAHGRTVLELDKADGTVRRSALLSWDGPDEGYGGRITDLAVLPDKDLAVAVADDTQLRTLSLGTGRWGSTPLPAPARLTGGARVAALYDAILLSSGVPGQAAAASAPGMRMVGGAAAVVTGRDRQGTVVGRADATGFARGRDLAEGRRSARTVPLSAPGKAWTDPMCLVPDQLALFNKAGASVALRSLGADGSADQTVDFPVQMVDPAPVRVFAPS